MTTINTQLEDLTASSALTGTETFYSDTGAADVKVTAEQIATFVATKAITKADSGFTLQSAGDATKQAKFSAGSISAATTRTFTFPDADTTLVGHDATQTLTNKTLALGSNTVSGTTAQFNTALTDGDFATLAGTEALTNKTIGNSNTFTARSDRLTVQDSADTTKQVTLDLSAIATATTRAWTFPDAADTFVGRTATQTLTNKTLTTPTVAQINNTGGVAIEGTNTNDNATSGNVGEYVSSSILVGSAVSLTSTVAANVTSISLTAGDWDVWGQMVFDTTATTDFTALRAATSRTSATLAPQGDDTQGRSNYVKAAGATGFNGDNAFPVPLARMSLSATTTVYLVALCDFSSSTLAAYGYIAARRVR